MRVIINFGALALLGVVCLPFLGLLRIATGGDLVSLGHLATTVLPTYVWTSLLLCVGSVLGALLLGVGSAWIMARYEFVGKRLIGRLLLLPLAMPVYVVAYVYADALQFSGPVQTALRAAFNWQKGDYFFPEMRSLYGACILFSVVLYPYVYLLAKDAFVAQGARLIDAARSLGLSPRAAFWQVALPSTRPAWAAGAALVAMECLADFGAVSYLSVDTFSVGIYRTWFGLADKSGAAQLSLSLLIFVGLCVALEQRERKQARYHQGGQAVQALPTSGLKGLGLAMLCLLPIFLGFLLPIALLLRLSFGESGFGPQVLPTVWNSSLLAALTIGLCVGFALLLGVLKRRASNVFLSTAERILALGYAAPGAVLAIAVLWLMGVLDEGIGNLSKTLIFTGSLFALLYAYTLRFYAVAEGSVGAGFTRISQRIDDAASSMGVRGFLAFQKVQWPLLKPSVLSASLLVFVDCLKELPATLSLRPFNFDTLATSIYQYTRDERLGEAALPSLLLVSICTLTILMLERLGRKDD